MDQRDVVMAPKHLKNFSRFVLTHQAVVNKNAGELVANGFVNEDRSNGRIHAAGQAADDLAGADLIADFLDHFFAVGSHGPIRL